MKENEHYQNDQEDGLKERMNDGINGLLDENRGVIGHRVIEAARKVLLQQFHRGANLLRETQGVGAGLLKDGNGHRGSVVEQRAEGEFTGTQFDARDVLEQQRFTMSPALHHDVAELLDRDQSAAGIDLKLEGHRALDRLLPHRTGGHLHVLFADGVDHVARSHAPRRQSLRVQPHPHGIVARAE